jgi:WD40 repeat protein
LQVFGCTGGQLLLRSLAAESPAKPEAVSYKVASHDITACSFSSDGGLLAFGCSDGKLALWDPSVCLQLTSYQLHKAKISCCSFSPDAGLLAAGDESGLLSVWDLQQGLLVQLCR